MYVLLTLGIWTPLYSEQWKNEGNVFFVGMCDYIEVGGHNMRSLLLAEAYKLYNYCLTNHYHPL